MALTEPFDVTTPLGSSSPTGGDDQLRSLKRAIKERAMRGGHYYTNVPDGTIVGGDDLAAGVHACGVDGDANQFIIYEEDRDTPGVIVDTDDGGTKSVTLGDGLTGANPYTLKADTLTGKRDHTVAIPLYGITTGRVKGTLFENRGGGVLTLLGAKLVCFTAPVTTTLNVDINRLVAGYTDPNAAGTTIWGAGNPTHPVVAASAFVSTEVTLFDPAVPTLDVGDAWVFDIDVLSAAADIVLLLRVRRTS